MGETALEKAKAEIPSGGGKIGLQDLFDSGSETRDFPYVIGATIGLQNKDMYSILERTRLTDEEIQISRDLINKASHGIGIPGLDMPVPQIGESLVSFLRGKVSLGGGSREEAERIMTAWLKTLYAQELAAKQQHDKLVGG